MGRSTLLLLPLLLLLRGASGEIKMSVTFGDHMVLQSNNINTKINGFASPGEEVHVDTVIRGNYSTVADADGWWSVFVPWEPPLVRPPTNITVTGSMTKEPIVARDVLFGDVFVCSGQVRCLLPLAPRSAYTVA